MKYINNSTEANVTDDVTRKLDGIVRETKARKDVGIRFMKSWERERELREEGRKEGRAEERAKREQAEKRAENAEKRAADAETRVAELEALLAAATKDHV